MESSSSAAADTTPLHLKNHLPVGRDYVLDHVAIAAWDIAHTIPFLEDELGGRGFSANESVFFDVAQWSFAEGNDFGGVIEVLQPPIALASDPKSLQKNFLHRYLVASGPSIHHITLKVGDIKVALEEAKAKGFEVVGVQLDRWPWWKEAFIHPKQPGVGVVVQIAQQNPETMPKSESRRWEKGQYFKKLGSHGFRATPSNVHLAGVHLVVHKRADAFRLWQDVLRGTPTIHSPNFIEFRWPDSAMSIFVTVDPDAEEGARCIELRQARPWSKIPQTLNLTHEDSPPHPHPHPILGVPFWLTTRPRTAPIVSAAL